MEAIEQRDAYLKEIEALRRVVKETTEKAQYAEHQAQVATEERDTAQQHRDIADAAREGALSAKKKAFQELEKVRSVKENLKTDWTKAQQELADLREQWEAVRTSSKHTF